MQMRPGRAPRAAHGGDALAAYDDIALPDVQLRCMRVARDQAVAMVDLDHPTILGVRPRGDDPAARGRDDRRARLGGKVDALVKRVLPGERVDPVAEVR